MNIVILAGYMLNSRDSTWDRMKKMLQRNLRSAGWKWGETAAASYVWQP